MIRSILYIRLKQAGRAATGLGLGRCLFLAGVSGFLAFLLFLQTAAFPNSLYAAGIYLAVIFLLQLNRPDKQFLKITFIHHKVIFLAEYLLLLIPLLICLAYHQLYQLLTATFVIAFLITNVDYKARHRSMNTMIQRVIPASCFEWKSGVRTSLVLMGVVWVTGMYTSFFIASVPVVLFFLGILPLGFYERGEPVQMVLAYEMGAVSFILHKIKMQVVLFTILSMPLILAFCIFHPDIWYIPVLEFLVLITSQGYLVLVKYAFYQPNTKPGGAQVFGLLGTIGLIIPILIPLVWLLSVRFYFKSVSNLNFYLDDYN